MALSPELKLNEEMFKFNYRLASPASRQADVITKRIQFNQNEYSKQTN